MHYFMKEQCHTKISDLSIIFYYFYVFFHFKDNHNVISVCEHLRRHKKSFTTTGPSNQLCLIDLCFVSFHLYKIKSKLIDLDSTDR